MRLRLDPRDIAGEVVCVGTSTYNRDFHVRIVYLAQVVCVGTSTYNRDFHVRIVYLAQRLGFRVALRWIACGSSRWGCLFLVIGTTRFHGFGSGWFANYAHRGFANRADYSAARGLYAGLRGIAG
ncbi:hypothetical protein OPAG_08114 [Rhodococcus opacus PD630]|nr:hypothetical protein OPAG_08114 [Rhodococcus opacus PD630]